MALLNTIASVCESGVNAFRRDPAVVVDASLVGSLSSFGMGGWTDPLGVLLQEAMLEGEQINASLQHDRDVPRFHAPARVLSLRARMDAAWRDAGPGDKDPNSYDDWVRSEFSTAHRIVRHAAHRGECVVTAWEVIGGVGGAPLRVRERSARSGDDPFLSLSALASVPRPLLIAGAVVGAAVAIAAWRQRRMLSR